MVLENTAVLNKGKIKNAINSLRAGGSTNGSAGITLAYNENESHFVDKGVNRVILMSDGDFNVGLSSVTSLEEMISEKRKTGVSFSTVGIGGNNYKDNRMEKIANKGNGTYTFLGDIHDAREVFSDRFIGTIKNIAKDVKYQVEFNPANVKEYRLIGYENRLLNNEDFKNDNVDAGELPSGSTVTALYEITLSNQEGRHPESRYTDERGVVWSDALDTELAFIKVRYKQPDSGAGTTLSFPAKKELIDAPISKESNFIRHVAGFAQLYRNSKYLDPSYTYQSIIDSLEKDSLKGERWAFLESVKATSVIKQ